MSSPLMKMKMTLGGAFVVLVLSSCSSRGRLASESELKDFAELSTAASSSPSEDPAATSGAAQDDKIVAGDLLTLSSLADRKLNGGFRVDFEGGLSLPYNVYIPKAAGSTLDELSARIRESYKPFFSGGRVSVEVQLKQRQVWLDVRGLVQKPGKILASPTAGLDEILSQAGGASPGANVDEVRISRGAETSTVALADFFGSGVRSARWHGGETLFFRPAEGRGKFFDPAQAQRSVQILGEVRTPGVFAFRSGADYLEYLAQAQGPTSLADLTRIEIVRGKVPNAKSVFVDFADKNRLPVPAPGDLVIVHAEKARAIERAMPVLTGFATLASTILLFIIAL